MEPGQPSPLGSLLLYHRKLAELTQESLAERAGVSVNTISNMEAGQGRIPRYATLDLLVGALASALGLAASERAALRKAFKAAAESAHHQRVPPLVEAPGASTAGAVPTGTMTFLICNLAPSAGDPQAINRPARFDAGHIVALLRKIIPPLAGHLVMPTDDMNCPVCLFSRPEAALSAACSLQQTLRSINARGKGGHAGAGVPIGLALHSGWAEPGTGDYDGPTLHRAVRLARAAHAGQLLVSDAVRAALAAGLPEDLRLQRVGAYCLSAVERPQPVYHVQHSGHAEVFPPLHTPQAPPTNLPLQVTSFIGRAHQQTAVGQLLTAAPLVTLVGAGGCGKTRLALQVAADRLEHYPDGVWLVELAALGMSTYGGTSPVAPAVAAVLGLREEPHRSLQITVLDALTAKRMLLVLDNCEHLIADCAAFSAAVLRTCPYVALFATSRERLAVRGERLYQVPSLSVPARGIQAQAQDAAASEAVSLFVDRARSVLPTFALTDENVDVIIRICARLDGIPLAIELAAARTRQLALEAIVARLEESMALLTGGPRDVLPRHQTLKATLDWSWDLLDAEERALLAQLSIFVGGWTTEAAARVCVPDGSSTDGDMIAAVVERLADKSLVLQDGIIGGTRFRLLETVRQYAADRLAEYGQTERALRGRHLQWCLELVEQVAPHLEGPDQSTWLALLDREHDNIRVGLRCALEQHAGEQGLALAGAMGRFWQMRGYLGEGRHWLGEMLADDQMRHATPAVRARALNGAGNLADSQGDYRQASTNYQEALHLWRELDDRRGIAMALNGLGNVAQKQGHYTRAVTLHEEALALRRAQEDTWSVAASLSNLAIALNLQGRRERAAALLEEALAYKRAVGDIWGTASTLNNLGRVVAENHEYERAVRLHEEALRLRRMLGDTMGIATSLRNLGSVAAATGEHGPAARLFEEALHLQRTLGDRLGVADSLYQLGRLAFMAADIARATVLLEEAVRVAWQIGVKDVLATGLEGFFWVSAASGRMEQAVLLCAAAERLHRDLGLVLTSEESERHEQALRAVKQVLGAEHLAALLAEAGMTPLDEIISKALAANGPNVA